MGGTDAALWSGSAVLLNEIWYKDFPRSSFHAFNDAGNWLYMDKFGHAYTAYQLSGIQYTAWRFAGLKPGSAILLAGGISWGYQATVEVLDGFSAEWGFSWADLSANTVGAALFMSQQWWWEDQRIRLKFGFRSSPYAALRPEILGSGFTERLLKDYNAQSYWLCAAPAAFMSSGTSFPPWLEIGIGYSADGMLKGDSDMYQLNGFTYRARPEFALSLDVDWRKLPIRPRWLKTLLSPLNAVKIPLPAVFWRDGTCYVGLF